MSKKVGENLESNDVELQKMRHSLAHILAQAVLEMFPEAKLGIGPAIDNGFYYDFELPRTLIPEDLKILEKKMKHIVAQNQSFHRVEEPVDKAIEFLKGKGQIYKAELAADFKAEGAEIVSFYENRLTNDGTLKFWDLCRGGHTESTGKVGVFKLHKIAGAYWKGSAERPMLQRIYGLAFWRKEELDTCLSLIEEAKKRDHRKIAQELDLVVFSELVGSGLPLFTPKGTILRDAVENFSQELQAEYGYKKVHIPHIAKVDLYKVSGHYEKYPEKFTVTSFESDQEFMMKPMNCPHHTQIYASRQRSYRDLPIRYMENTMIYRDEKAGELHGLSRVRAVTQDDGHVFCTVEQIEEEFEAIMKMIKRIYEVFGMKFKARLSFRNDEDKYLGDKEVWELAQNKLLLVANKLGLDYVIAEGEAAFYGPKIDIMIVDALGREWQCATEQLDFVVPERFGLTYKAADGSEKRPVMIHKALLGSTERFLAVFIEHCAGIFPTWMAPVQVVLVPVAEAHVEYAKGLEDELLKNGVRVEIAWPDESLGKRIRHAEMQKVPYMVVLGDKEVAHGGVSVRGLKSKVRAELTKASFIERLIKEVRQRSIEYFV